MEEIEILQDILRELKDIRHELKHQNEAIENHNVQAFEGQKRQQQKIKETLTSIHPGIGELVKKLMD